MNSVVSPGNWMQNLRRCTVSHHNNHMISICCPALQRGDVALWKTHQTIWGTPTSFIKRKREPFPQHFLSFKWASSNKSLIWKLPSFSFIANPFQAQRKAKCDCRLALTFFFFFFSSLCQSHLQVFLSSRDRVLSSFAQNPGLVCKMNAL